ncbi:deoxycytidylate deaminase-like [Erpetoichthys calabaricus]|uniref:deoxycytidylate deaminase-like n=1 Tax=Erpetoichthys calabaricus TaxID=27687 RepID=UPI00109F4CC5|nr:deoxycytidylate deaminase-like [Erpetoichthys calabaricus]XP_051782734.1 deoxycytidylate deaminase-like [Erpetoichthys calabaricus]
MNTDNSSKSSSGYKRIKTNPACEGQKRILRNEEYFMAVAVLSKLRSGDPNTQVGACIVNPDNNIVGVGYNEMPRDCEGQFPWDNELKKQKDKQDDNKEKPCLCECHRQHLNTKYFYVCHAELNAIISSNAANLKGCTIYVTLFPCNECAKLIIQSGIKNVVYLDNKYRAKVQTKASRIMLDKANIEYTKFQACENIVIDFNSNK